MLTAEGCRQRRIRLWERLDPKPPSDHLRLGDAIHLAYLANFHVDPISLGAGFGGSFFAAGRSRDVDSRKPVPNRLEEAHVDERKVVNWYDSQAPASGPRQLAVLDRVNPAGSGSASTTALATRMRQPSSRRLPTCAGKRIPTRSPF